MELSDASLRLTGWEVPADMQEHSCSCCDQEANLHRPEPSTVILRQIALGIRRMTQTLTFGLVSLILVIALLIAVVFGGRNQFPDKPAMPSEKASFVSETQQQLEHPSAFLTAPSNGTNHGRYLKWETMSGNAYCRGFRYSGGNLTVLRDGYYSINLQITLINIEGLCNTNHLTMTVFIFKDEYRTFNPLLVTHDTMCCAKQCKKSLFTSGVFFLKANTILQVEAVHAKHITRRQNEHEVFFSVHLQS